MKRSNEKIVCLDKECKWKVENTYPVLNIDNILEMHGLFRLKDFAYAVGDCLFNTLQVLLHFRYTVT